MTPLESRLLALLKSVVDAGCLPSEERHHCFYCGNWIGRASTHVPDCDYLKMQAIVRELDSSEETLRSA